MSEWIELTAAGMEYLAVAILGLTILAGFVVFLVQRARNVGEPYRAYKELIGRALLLTLEILVAADVIDTVAVEQTPRSIGMLAGLVVIRTFLSWSVVVETEGHWPWRGKPASSSE